MDSTSATEFVASLSNGEKLRLLAHLSYNLTIVARDTYGADGDVKDARRLRALNEVQHRILAALRSLTAGHEESRMPDEALLAMFFVPRDDKPLSGLLEFAFEQAMAAVAGDKAPLGRAG